MIHATAVQRTSIFDPTTLTPTPNTNTSNRNRDRGIRLLEILNNQLMNNWKMIRIMNKMYTREERELLRKGLDNRSTSNPFIQCKKTDHVGSRGKVRTHPLH